MASPDAGPVLVTGATGFLGTHVVRALVAAGVRVRALVRGGGGASPEVTACCVADLNDHAALERACSGVQAVVHLAGRAHVSGEPPDAARLAFERVNVAGTRAVVAAARVAGVPLVVHVSSIGAVATTAGQVVTAHTRPAPDTPYGVSKLRSEKAAAEAADATQAVLVLRPTLVYGPAMRGNPLRLFNLVARGVPLPVAGVANRRSVLYVSNFAADVVAAVGRAWAPGVHTFAVADGLGVSTAELAEAMGRALGRPARLVRCPLALLRAAGAVGSMVRHAVPVPITRDAVERFAGSLVVDAHDWHEALGHRPRVSLDDALAATATWYRTGAGGPVGDATSLR